MPSAVTESVGRTKLVADVALYHGNRVLLVKYREVEKYDGQTGWFLPDDYLRRLEHPEAAGLRILREQVGVDLPSLDIGFIESFEGNGAWHLVFHFVGRLRGDAEVAARGNTAEVKWFDRSSLPDRSGVAHEGWAIDVLQTLDRARAEALHGRSVVE
jgi:ADP-ribose pyrophosphatase YjhB (NUDIX family)